MVKIRFNKEKKEWIFLTPEDEPTDYDITIDGKLYKILLAIKKDLKNELDHVMLVGGSVGSGKSNVARIMCRIVSNEHFHPRTHIIRDVNDIERVISHAKKGDGVIFDEGSGLFSATDTMTKKTKYANYILDVCRQRFLFLVIVAPAVHRLTSAVAIDRTKTMVRTYISKRTGRRGPFAFYGKKLKERLFFFGKKNYGSIKGCGVKFRGNISLDKTFTDEYKRVKDETLNKALQSFNKKKKNEVSKSEQKKIVYKRNIELVEKNINLTIKEAAKLLGLSPVTICSYRKVAKRRINKRGILLNQLMEGEE